MTEKNSLLAEKIAQSLVIIQQPPAGHGDQMARFFKAFPGGYGEGDKFLGITVPVIRQTARHHRTISLQEIEQLLDSPWHEVRLVGVIIMSDICKSKRTSEELRKALYDLYLRRTDAVNNWDLVDLSCRDVLGGYLMVHPEERAVLLHLAHSKNIWERRIAMVTTWEFIRNNQLDDTFTIATELLQDKHDLIHKAVGWMLREAGKRDETRLKVYLTDHISRLPRTALRYAIERLTPEERAHFMKLK